MKTRMQPIGKVFQRFPRVVRDLAAQCGKQVKVRMEGSETELDRGVLEAIKDPLTHLVRNSIDHGIEKPSVRSVRGKAEEGTLILRAYHEGGKVNIEIIDDGGGIDAELIRQKIVDRGMVSADAAAVMSTRDVLQHIFAPGFSTAAKVTNISGRGVGMDVVKTNIERIGGTVELITSVGVGTTFKIKIPLTLAIVPALVVLSGGYRYVLPQISLVELLRLDGDQARTGIELLHGAPVHRLRGQLLPIVDLNDILANGDGRGRLVEDAVGGFVSRDAVNVVVLQADDQQFGLVVDGVFDTQEIVVKPLGKQLKDATIFAGATIMGDGKVSLILDVTGIAKKSRVLGEQRERLLDKTGPAATAGFGGERTTLLVVDLAGQQAAVALSEVDRLEQFPRTRIERSRGYDVVQYRGQIVPIVNLASALGIPEQESGDDLDVVVYDFDGHKIGVAVSGIVDIVDEEVTVAPRNGCVSGTSVVHGRVTDVIDVGSIVSDVLVSIFDRNRDLSDPYADDLVSTSSY